MVDRIHAEVLRDSVDPGGRRNQRRGVARHLREDPPDPDGGDDRHRSGSGEASQTRHFGAHGHAREPDDIEDGQQRRQKQALQFGQVGQADQSAQHHSLPSRDAHS